MMSKILNFFPFPSSHPSIETCLQMHEDQRKQRNNREGMPYESGVSGIFLKMEPGEGGSQGW